MRRFGMRGFRFGALFALVAATGLVGATASFAASTKEATTSISAESEQTSAASADETRCGPCPTFIFGKGSGSGRVVATTRKTNGTTEVQTCVIPPPGQGVRDCDLLFDELSFTTLEAIPAFGSRFEHWQGCVADGPRCEISPGSAVLACVVFKLSTEPPSEDQTACPPPALLVYKSGDGAGSVTVTPSNATCDATCRIMSLRRWVQGTTLTLNAQASAGSRFVRWDGACASATGATCSFPLNTVTEVCPVFVKDGSAAPDDRSCPPRVTPPLAGGGGGGASASPPPLGSKCTIPGSRYGEVLRGTAGNDVICGGGGNDKIYGGGGHDLLIGGKGNDRLYGQGGNDRLVGGPGRDVLSGGPGADIIYARDRTRDLVNGGTGRDRARVDRIDVLRSIERRF